MVTVVLGSTHYMKMPACIFTSAAQPPIVAFTQLYRKRKNTFTKFIFQALVNILAPKNAEKFEVYENRSIICRFRKLTKLSLATR
jgi:hypothetical protein